MYECLNQERISIFAKFAISFFVPIISKVLKTMRKTRHPETVNAGDLAEENTDEMDDD